jgi:hypothetical protein
LAINLERAAALLDEHGGRRRFKHKRRAPDSEGLRVAPLRVVQTGPRFDLGSFRTEASVEVVLYEYGAVCVTYSIPVNGDLELMVGMSDLLYDNAVLLAGARDRVAHVLQVAEAAVSKSVIRPLVEDYVIFDISLPPGTPVATLWNDHGPALARVLRGEQGLLSEQEIADALSLRLSYTPDDAAVVDWYAAVLVGDDMQDERVVLEYGIVELLQLRVLDSDLDAGVDRAYELLAQRLSWIDSLRPGREPGERVSALQADAAFLFEGISNPLKLLGDQYLARLYRLVSNRFRLPEWDAAIERKLDTLAAIQDKLSGRAANRRLETLEWIIIVLIALSILVYFLPDIG